MEPQAIDPRIEKQLLSAQKNEITQHFVYRILSRSVRNPHNKAVLERIAAEELKHHDVCINFTCQDVKPARFKVWMYFLMSLVFGVTFSLKFMERAEGREHVIYSGLSAVMPETISIARDEIRHEQELLDMIDDERLNYSSDIVRGMNVAIVEITGTLAGLTFAFQNGQLVRDTVIIVGIIMSLSVMSTEYLAARADVHIDRPVKSLIYAGTANIITIFILLLPYYLIQNIYIAIGVSVTAAIGAIYVFSFYISVVLSIPVRKRFLEMLLISLGISALAFGIGLLARSLLHIHVI